MAFAQKGSIKGKVVDESNQPLPGASVTIDGTTIGSVTDAGGNYTISGVNNGSYTITAKFVGYVAAKKSITVSNSVSTLDFGLKPENTNLNEVVVIGYGTQRSKDLTGSIATVTAKDLGTDGNEPSGTEFAIGSDNTVAGKNDNAFSGGTKKTVTVVSANDLAKLRANLPKSVQGSAQQKLLQQADSGSTVLPLVSDPTLENQVFDKNIGDEATQVSLTASVVYSGLEYSNSDLDDFAKSIMKDKFPQDPNIANNSVKETINDAQERTSAADTATVSIQAGLLPNINNSDVISTIQHKSLGDAKKALGNLPQVESADIMFSPPIPLLPLLFPSLPHTISVTVKSQ